MEPDLLLVSWSGLRRYEECHQRHLRHIEGKKIGKPIDGRSFLVGNICDRTMRAWLDSTDPQPGEMLQMLPETWRTWTTPKKDETLVDGYRPVQWRGDPKVDQQELYDKAVHILQQLEPILLKYVVPYEYQPELSFRVKLVIPYIDGVNRSAIKLIGGIDVVVRYPTGDFILFDLKATTDDAYVAKVLGQGVFYTIAWGVFLGDLTQPKRFGFIAPGTKNQVTWTEIGAEERRAMLDRIVTFAHGMWREDWTPKADNEGCDYCDVRHACLKFESHMVKDDHGKNRLSFDTAAKRRTQRS